MHIMCALFFTQRSSPRNHAQAPLLLRLTLTYLTTYSTPLIVRGAAKCVWQVRVLTSALVLTAMAVCLSIASISVLLGLKERCPLFWRGLYYRQLLLLLLQLLLKSALFLQFTVLELMLLLPLLLLLLQMQLVLLLLFTQQLLLPLPLLLLLMVALLELGLKGSFGTLAIPAEQMRAVLDVQTGLVC